MNVCRDTSDAVALYLPQRLYLKPVAKINISVQLPPVKVHGKSISTWELMEKLRKLVQPETFSALKVSKTTSDVIRFDAELDTRSRLERVVSRLDDRTLKLSDYPDALRVRAAEAKLDFPSRHAWDAFFRDAPNMDEMKPGERPDTLHVTGLPVAWFSPAKERRDDDAPPSEHVFRKVFEKYGRVRGVDVPASDPFRRDMKPHMTGITIADGDSGVFFEGYVQFTEYVAFVRAMDALRGMKLVRREADGQLAECVDMAVDFDRTKHMTDAAVKRRAIVRERLAERQRAREEKEKEEKDKVSRRQQRHRVEAEGAERAQREREERRKRKQLARLVSRERGEVRAAVAEEERRLVDAQRRLQALRLVEELFRRIEIKNTRRGAGGGAAAREGEARERVVRRIKGEQEAELDKQRTRLQKAYEGSIVLRAVLETRRPRSRSASASSPESPPPPHAHRVKREKLTTPEREMHRSTGGAGMYPGLVAPYGFPYLPHLPHLPHLQSAAYPYQHHPQDMYYGGGRGGGGGYYPPPSEYAPRGAGRFPARRPRGRALYRGGPRMPYFDGPNASHEYYKYFKRLSEAESAHQQHDDRTRSRSRSRSRRRSYSRSRSRSRSRRRRRSRSYSRSSRSYSRSRSRSHDRRRRSRSRSRRSRASRSPRGKSRSRSRRRSDSTRRGRHEAGEAPPPAPAHADKPNVDTRTRSRSKSWSLPADTTRARDKSWSKSPNKQL